MKYKAILVAVDVNDPDNARAAINHSAGLAGPDTKVRMLFVRYFLPNRYADLLAMDFDELEHHEAIKSIKVWTEEAGLDPDNVSIITRRGRVRDEVLNEAEEINADLIIIGSHQPSITSRLLGSNASAIVHSSPISVLVVRT